MPSEENANNLRFYIRSKQPPAEALKPFKREGGFGGTDINAMWRIKQLTDLFGPCGIGWYTEVTRREIVAYDPLHQKAFVDINLYIRDPNTMEWSKPIQGTGGNDWVKQRKSGDVVVNDECFKMAETDALGSACKKLGFAADIYWEQDKSKYTIDENGDCYEVIMTAEEAKQAKAQERLKASEGFMKRPQTEAKEFQEDPSGFQMAEACEKAINGWISKNIENAGHEVIASYADRFGQMNQWNAGTYIQCYKELKDAKVPDLPEVAL